MTCYVSMTDRFMSGWGMARNKVAKYIYECKDMTEALIVKQNAIDRGDQKYISISACKPRFDEADYYVTWVTNDGEHKYWYDASRPWRKQQ